MAIPRAAPTKAMKKTFTAVRQLKASLADLFISIIKEIE